MKTNVYLDCGGHYGEGLREFIQSHKINDDWIVETFEPNPECQYIERISDIKLKNIIVHDEAVWIFDGEIMFSQENHSKSNSKSPNDGKSNIDGWGSVITELYSTHLKYAEEPIMVKCVDFHKILSKYPKDKFNVIVKLDIEGAEYSVLRHIISEGSAVNISELYVEWHHVDLTDENMSTTNNLINTLSMIGINVKNWK
jgi:FkbM family methyltransferase